HARDGASAPRGRARRRWPQSGRGFPRGGSVQLRSSREAARADDQRALRFPVSGQHLAGGSLSRVGDAGQGQAPHRLRVGASPAERSDDEGNAGLVRPVSRSGALNRCYFTARKKARARSVRGFSVTSEGGPSSISLPSSNTQIRDATFRANHISCVTTSIVVVPARSRRTESTSPRISGSSALVGSSSS